MGVFKVLAATVLSASLLAASPARAMEIRQYDKMASQDRSEYAAELIEGAQRVLINQGKSDLAAQINKLFTETPPGDDVPVGIVEFRSNLDLARFADAERALKDPNAHRLEIEDALLVTLQKNKIPMPQEFVRGVRAINAGFQPQYPPQK